MRVSLADETGIANFNRTIKACALAAAILTAVPMAAADETVTDEYLASHPDKFIAGAIRALKWEEPMEPVHIVGPIYYVGTRGLGAYLITTSEGHIVVNTGMPSSGPMMVSDIVALGFKPDDVKVLLSVHAHIDHVGAIAYLKKATSAKFALMEGDVAAMQDGGRSDFHYGKDEAFYFPPATVDRVLRDGDVVRLGEIAITALSTSGHTRGNTTFVLEAVEGGK